MSEHRGGRGGSRRDDRGRDNERGSGRDRGRRDHDQRDRGPRRRDSERNRGHGARREGFGRRDDRRETRPQVDGPRLLAHRVLSKVETDGAYANLALPHALRDAQLTARDAAFITELVYGTLRLQGRYDAVIAACLDGRSVDSLQPALRIGLRMGAHQILGMRVPERAAVYETVSLVRVTAGPAPVSLANAVLRKVAAASFEEWERTVTENRPELEQLATWQSHPAWIVRAYRQALSLEGSDTLQDLLIANNTPAPITLVARPGLIHRDELAKQIPGATPTPHSPFGLHIPGGDPGEIPAIQNGAAAVQDEGSQLVALLAAQIEIDGPDAMWLDMCAGPGGKAGLLGALAEERGARLVANEVAPHRADLVRQTVRQLDNVEVVEGDGRTIGNESPNTFDRILLDAPCTGLGSLRRRPESRWRKSEADLTDLTALQRDLLDSAARALRPGGVLLYATCSPHLAETVTQVLDAARRNGLRFLPLSLEEWGIEMPNRRDHPAPETVQLWPHTHGTDAMFAAALTKDS